MPLSSAYFFGCQVTLPLASLDWNKCCFCVKSKLGYSWPLSTWPAFTTPGVRRWSEWFMKCSSRTAISCKAQACAQHQQAHLSIGTIGIPIRQGAAPLVTPNQYTPLSLGIHTVCRNCKHVGLKHKHSDPDLFPNWHLTSWECGWLTPFVFSNLKIPTSPSYFPSLSVRGIRYTSFVRRDQPRWCVD